MTIPKQIRGDDFNAHAHLQKCTSNDDLEKVLLNYVPLSLMKEYLYQKEIVNITPRTCCFMVYNYLKMNEHSLHYERIIKKISENLKISEEIISKSLDILIDSEYIIDYILEEYEDETIYYYDII